MAKKIIEGDVKIGGNNEISGNIEHSESTNFYVKNGGTQILIPYANGEGEYESVANSTFDSTAVYYVLYGGEYVTVESRGVTITAENFDTYKSRLYIQITPPTNNDITFPQKSGIVIVADSTPTIAGTYKLQCVVDSDGNPTFSWVADN